MMFVNNLSGRDRFCLYRVEMPFRGIRQSISVFGSILVGVVMLGACNSGGKYFQDGVNAATQAMVGKRYGTPHKVRSYDGGETWTYFERGSGTAGFSGQVRSGGCQAYVLTFDKETVLRGWQKQPCEG